MVGQIFFTTAGILAFVEFGALKYGKAAKVLEKGLAEGYESAE